ncbi:MAG: sigma-54-dependent transcriptional regulator [Candidatus Brocadiia bacterium]
MKRILVIDDEADALRVVLDEVLEDYPVLYAESGQAGLAKLADDVGLVLLDINMPPTVGQEREREGLAVMAEIARRRPQLPVVMFTGYAEVGLALEAGRLGAFDYLVKMPHPDRLLAVVERALAIESAPARRPADRPGLGRLVGASTRMQKLYSDIERIAPTSLPVLLLGPTGSGKDLVAREIHDASVRADGPFRAVNVSAIPRELFESVLFGHARGSFTGATEDKAGEFEAASGGTLFLDEIGTLSPEVQVKLLRALEEKTVTRLGETTARPVDARVITATNANLLREVREGRFREDLYYRLRVATVMVPPLADRPEDIPLLAQHFLDRTIAEEGLPQRTLSPEALECLRQHPWPGNVRELANAIRSAVVFADGPTIGPDDIDLDAGAGLVTVHDPDGLYEDQKAGRTAIGSPREFKAKFGEEALRHVLRAAVEETHDQARAGVLLGFLAPDHTPAQYNTFRQWFRRVGLTSRDILR